MAVNHLSKAKYTIPAQSTQTINFLGAKPNHYKIVNGNTSPLYVGVSMMPTKDFFDAKIPASSSKLCVDAYGHEEIYIYNPSLTDANIIITSFEAPFDASTLGLSDLGQDFTSIEVSGEFDATGDLATRMLSINEYIASLPYIHNNQLSIIESLKTLGTINTKLNTTIGNVESIKLLLQSYHTPICNKFAIETNTDAEYQYVLKHIELLSNDGTNDMTVIIGGNRFILKAGEVLNKLTLNENTTIKIYKGATYRLIGGN